MREELKKVDKEDKLVQQKRRREENQAKYEDEGKKC